MQIGGLVDDAHLLLIITDNFDEITHDITEECNTTKHDNNRNNSLHIADREVIAVAHSAQRCQRIVATNDKLELFILFL